MNIALLDLSEAFGTVNHSLLIEGLDPWVGVMGVALDLQACSSAPVVMSSGLSFETATVVFVLDGSSAPAP